MCPRRIAPTVPLLIAPQHFIFIETCPRLCIHMVDPRNYSRSGFSRGRRAYRGSAIFLGRSILSIFKIPFPQTCVSARSRLSTNQCFRSVGGHRCTEFEVDLALTSDSAPGPSSGISSDSKVEETQVDKYSNGFSFLAEGNHVTFFRMSAKCASDS
jgi:hypothetical protein